MSEQAMPPSAPVSPYLAVHDAAAAIEFYTRAFGAELVMKEPGPDHTRLIHVAMLVNGGLVMFADEFPEFHEGKRSSPTALGGTTVTIHLACPDVEQMWDRAVKAGAKIAMPLAEQFWGDKYGVLEDPFGHRWSLAQRK